jgi:hypothetical protein
LIALKRGSKKRKKDWIPIAVSSNNPYTDRMKNKNTEIKHYIEVNRYDGTVSILDLNDEDAVENLNWFMENGEKSEGEGGYITWDGEESMIIQVPA